MKRKRRSTVDSSRGKSNPRELPTPITRPSTSTRPKELDLTDSGNAELFVRLHGKNLRYCQAWSKWLSWNGTHWETNRSGTPLLLTKSVARRRLEDASRQVDDDERKRTVKWAIASDKAERRRAMLGLASSEPEVQIAPTELDRKPWLLNCKNGTLDLRTGNLRRHDPSDYLTKRTRVAFDPAAECPRWNAFLEEVLPDPEVREFVRRAVGWSMTGDVSSQVLFFCYGLGANGKSVFLGTIMDLLGEDYAIQGAPDLLLSKGTRAHPTELADLAGVRLVSCIELGAHRSIDEALVKQLTGQDKVRARRMREDFWQFEPTHHIWIAANHRPAVRGNDDAIWRRIMVVPFDVTIAPDRRDRGLMEALAEERSGILNWALEGCRDWHAQGLAPPDSVRLATQDYREDMDAIGGFLDACCVEDPAASVSAGDLFRRYERWCVEAGEQPLLQRGFGTRMTERGAKRIKRHGVKHYQGLALRTSVPTADDDFEEGDA